MISKQRNDNIAIHISNKNANKMLGGLKLIL